MKIRIQAFERVEYWKDISVSKEEYAYLQKIKDNQKLLQDFVLIRTGFGHQSIVDSFGVEDMSILDDDE